MKQIVRIIGYIVVLGMLVASLVWVHTHVRTVWKEVAMRQALLQDVPAQTSRTSALKKELDAALFDLQGIHRSTPTRDGLVDVISAISAQAVAAGISAQVPQVQATSPEESPLPDSAFSDVRIHVVASGDPAALASFLYRVEHLPYIIRVAFWKIDSLQQAAITSFANMAVPSGAPQAVNPPLGSSLEADIVIVTKNK